MIFRSAPVWAFKPLRKLTIVFRVAFGIQTLGFFWRLEIVLRIMECVQ
jgi:hypothetical protein